jgi:hypothetical protein
MDVAIEIRALPPSNHRRISAALTSPDRVIVEQRHRSAAASFGTAAEPSTC